MKWLIVGLVLAAALVAGAFVARARWMRATDDLVTHLRTQAGPADGTYAAAMLDGLPAPVARYFRAVLRDGQPLVRHARLRQEGTFLMRAEPATWVPFRAWQELTARPAGFVWSATMRMAPLTDVFVRDAFVDGAGTMRASVLGLKTMVNQHGTPAIARGSLLRYLAEAVWMPTALLPSDSLRWTPVDDTRAVATLTAQGTTVSLEFRFGADSLVTAIEAERERDMDGTLVPMMWHGEWFAWAERGGMRIPTEGEVAWIRPDGRREPYWRGKVTDVTFE